MKKILIWFTAVVCVFTGGIIPCNEVCALEEPSVSAKGAVLISADTGEVVYSFNHNEKLPMASTTKIMTTLLCLESGDLYEEFTVDSEAIKVEGSSMGLQEGDIVTKYALCCGMMLPSGNDSANAVAVKVAGSVESFVELMNEKAQELGLSRTYFATPSGLDGKGHGSTAYEMALLAREALKNDTFREICSSETIKLSYGNPPYDRWLTNTNKLLAMCDGVYGVKTGFTDDAGRCLVSACEREGERLICVTLNDKNDWNDHIALYDYGFEQVESFKLELPQSFEINIVGADTDRVTLTTAEEDFVSVTTLENNKENYAFEVLSAPFVYAPVDKAEELAQLRVMYKGEEICTVPLYADESIQRCEKLSPHSSERKSIVKWITEKLRKLFF